MLEQGLRAHLLADESVAAIVGPRVYALQLPQRPTYPAITFRRVGVQRFPTLDGGPELAGVRVQVDCMATGYEAAKNLAAAVRGALHGHRGDLGGVVVQSVELDGGETDLDEVEGDRAMRWVSLDFSIWLIE